MDTSDQVNGDDKDTYDTKDSQEVVRHVHRRRTMIPGIVKKIMDGRKHQSQKFRALNALFFYNDAQQGKKRDQQLSQLQKAKQQQRDKIKKEKERKFPSKSFALVLDASNDNHHGPDLRGSVSIPGNVELSCVEAYAIECSFERTHVLIVLYETSNPSIKYTVLCDRKYLPAGLRVVDCIGIKKREWLVDTYSFSEVYRANQRLQFIVSDRLKNRTCDDAMAQSLLSGVLAVRGRKNKPKYGLLPRRFNAGTTLPASQVFVITCNSMGMHLSHPPRGSDDVPAKILSCALMARDSLRTEVDSMAKALGLMESYSSSQCISERDRCLNVALGGTPSFVEYGRIIPCTELHKSCPFPNGSFAQRPCSCDISSSEEYPINVTAAIQRMFGPNKGHNFVTKKR